MRRFCRTLTVALISLLVLLSSSPDAASAPRVLVQPVGREIPSLIDGQTVLVSLRPFCEAVGAALTWNPSANAARVTYGSKQLTVPARGKTLYANGSSIQLSAPIRVVQGRTYVPLAALTNQLALTLRAGEAFTVYVPVTRGVGTSIMGQPAATLEQARNWLERRAPRWTWIADLYYEIAPKYGVRADVALAQACKETGNFEFGGLIYPEQNNYAGIGATGAADPGRDSLNGADPARVAFTPGIHGAVFVRPEYGIEAQIQHLYAYATTAPLPEGTVLVDPRFTFVSRGTASIAEYLGAAENPTGSGWAYPGVSYGHSLVKEFLQSLLSTR